MTIRVKQSQSKDKYILSEVAYEQAANCGEELSDEGVSD